MAIIQQISRFEFHTLTSTASFTIPLQEDFTLNSSTLSWVNTDLGLSEIGVSEGNQKAFIRIGPSIKEFQFNSGGATGGLQSVLAIDNTSGTNNIIMGTSTNIHSSDGGGQLDLDYSFPNSVLLSTDNATLATSHLQVYDSSNIFNDPSSNGSILLSTNNVNLQLHNTTSTIELIAKTISLIGQAQTYTNGQWIYKTNEIQTINTTVSTIIDTITVGTIQRLCTIKAYVNGYAASPGIGYGAELFGTFKFNTGSGLVNIIGSVSKIEKTEFAGASCDLVESGFDNTFNITVNGVTSSSINWVVRYEYLQSK